MAYLSTNEYTWFGLEDTTPDSLVIAASDLIDAHCKRKGFGIAQYMERFRVGRSRTVRLSYLPLAAAVGASSPIVLARGRYTTTDGAGRCRTNWRRRWHRFLRRKIPGSRCRRIHWTWMQRAAR